MKNNIITVALAGNPNVGKSTVFNALTGMKQHTGNWAGKTVSTAKGVFKYKDINFELVDLPGTYSLMSISREEQVARNYICFNNPDLCVIVVDAVCLERNLNLVLQILEINHNVVLCVNLIDEAEKKGIKIDTDELSLWLGIPVVATNAQKKIGLENLKEKIFKLSQNEIKTFHVPLKYDKNLTTYVEKMTSVFDDVYTKNLNKFQICVNLLENNEDYNISLIKYLNLSAEKQGQIKNILDNIFKTSSLTSDDFCNLIVKTIVSHAEKIAQNCIVKSNPEYDKKDRKIDKILTSKLTGIPIMLILLGIIFWITIVGANYPSELLSSFFAYIYDRIQEFCTAFGMNGWLKDMLLNGVYKTVTWVISVMLPPMAIFFPLFTILEDCGYLPRIAFNLDRFFEKAGVHGKQALTMCMGFGCNACGVTGCRIIDSPRERLIAVITNSFVPCNGRYPTLIAVISIFFTFSVAKELQSVYSALLLLLVIVFSVFMTLVVSKLLSITVLKGMPSTFSLELPPYRKIQVGKIIIRSLLDRTVFVLARAVCVALPAGALIWLFANINIGDSSILNICANFLDPLGKCMGLDGIILIAFILGFPANEIVMPIALMGYMANGTLINYEGLPELSGILIANGWTWVTGICFIVFSLIHFPCATTCLTIKKETGSLKWTAFSFLFPTILGILICMTLNFILKLIA